VLVDGHEAVAVDGDAGDARALDRRQGDDPVRGHDAAAGQQAGGDDAVRRAARVQLDAVPGEQLAHATAAATPKPSSGSASGVTIAIRARSSTRDAVWQRELVDGQRPGDARGDRRRRSPPMLPSRPRPQPGAAR
jgi:hypothetical protein